MHLRVDLTPRHEYRDVVVIIDVLRTCTLASILFDRGLETLYLSPSIRKARRLAEAQPLLLIGEREGLPPEGFNYGTSPAEVARAEVAGRSAVLVSRHVPQAVARTTGARHVLLGSLHNADAVVARAAASAEHEVALVCTGFRGDEDLDDTLCAGYLAALLKRHFTEATLGGAALFAINLLKAFPAPVGALWGSRAGQHLRHLDLTDDIAVGSLVSQTDAAPQLVDGEEGLYRFATKL